MTSWKALVLLVLLVAALAACDVPAESPELVESANEAADTAEQAVDEAPAEAPAPEAAAPGNFAVGDLVALGNLQVRVHEVRDPLEPTEFMPPAEGSRYVGVDMEVTNTAAEPELFSYLMSVELQDSQNITYSPTFTDHQPSPPDGELAPGNARRGLVVFEVPQSATELRLNFDGSVFGTGQVTVDL
jgi:hypothetical protein